MRFTSIGLVILLLTAPAWAQGGSHSDTNIPTGTNDQGQAMPPAIGTPATPPTLTGSYQATLNTSLLGKPRPSLGHRLNLSYIPSFGGSFDTRLEYYIDGSYNADPPGVLAHNVNEPKFEAQVMYNRPLAGRLGFTGGLLYHKNFRFPDRYYWAVTGLTYAVPLGRNVTFSPAALLEKKLGGVRPFCDLSSTLEYRFAPQWNTQLSYHRYENVGQFDPKPTQKEEYEIGLNRALRRQQSVGISLFRHTQFGAPNDQFTFLKIKYGIGF